MRNDRYRFQAKGPEGHTAHRAQTTDFRQREILLIRSTIAEVEHLIFALDRSIEVEKELTGVRDRLHFAYSMSARAMETRRNNLKVTRDALVERLSSVVGTQVDQAAA